MIYRIIHATATASCLGTKNNAVHVVAKANYKIKKRGKPTYWQQKKKEGQPNKAKSVLLLLHGTHTCASDKNRETS
jgi:hypothetical protein